MPVHHPLYPSAPHLLQEGRREEIVDFRREVELSLKLSALILQARAENCNAYATVPAESLLSLIMDLHTCRETIVRMHCAAAGAPTASATIGHIEDIQNYRERSEEARLVAVTLLKAVDGFLDGVPPERLDLQWARKVLSPERYDPAAVAATAFHTAKKGT